MHFSPRTEISLVRVTRCTKVSQLGVLIRTADNAFKDLRDIKLYPSIGMKRPHAHLSANFGQKPFVFNIDGMMNVSILFGSASN